MIQFNDPIFREYCRAITNIMQNGVLVVKFGEGEDLSVAFVNEVALNSIGYSEEQYLASDPFDLIYATDHERVRGILKRVKRGERVSDVYRIVVRNNGFIWARVQHSLLEIEGEKYMFCSFTSVDELMGAQIRLQSEGEKWVDIVNSIPMGIAIFAMDDKEQVSTIAINEPMVNFANYIGKVLDGNDRRWTSEELTVLINHSIYAFCSPEDYGIVKQMLDDSKTQNIAVCTFKLRGSTDENPVFVKSSCFSKEASETIRNYYVTFEDVTKDVMQELELEKNQDMLIDMSFHDALTHVKNRNAYNIMLDNTAKMHLKKVGIAFADINGLKSVNDTLGHKYGDTMICRFTDIVKEYFETDRIYRISGDEFVIIFPGVERGEFNLKLENIINDIANADHLASIGYIWEENLSDIKQQIDRAEQMMYVEKQRFYEDARTLKSKHRPLVLKELLSDFDNRRFKVFLQPKADIVTSKVIGAEALVRKEDIYGNIILPYEFVPQLEKEKLIPKIDFYMLEEVCDFLARMKREGYTDFKISVNMSRVTLAENDYIETVEKILDKYDFNIDQLEFEITESTETIDTRRLEDYIKKIKELGISISLDDVGTDYSSLPMLLVGGIDTVKLDRSLIIQIKNKQAFKLLKHVTDMCHDLGMDVIAEGVESDDIRSDLSDLKCDYYQGYLLSRPIPAEEFWKKYIAV